MSQSELRTTIWKKDCSIFSTCPLTWGWCVVTLRCARRGTRSCPRSWPTSSLAHTARWGRLLGTTKTWPSPLPEHSWPFSGKKNGKDNFGDLLQWECEYQWPFDYQKHLNTDLFEVQISNGLVFKWWVYGISYVVDQPFEYRSCT